MMTSGDHEGRIFLSHPQTNCGFFFLFTTILNHTSNERGAQWLSGRVLDSRPKGSGFEPNKRHCVVVLEQDTFILA